MNNQIKNLNDLHESVNRLKILLDDPQTGLMSWCMLYSEKMKEISDFWMNNNRSDKECIR